MEREKRSSIREKEVRRKRWRRKKKKVSVATGGSALHSWRDEARGRDTSGDLNSMILEHVALLLILSKQRCLHDLPIQQEKCWGLIWQCSQALPVSSGGISVYLQCVRVDAQRGRDVAGTWDAVRLHVDETSKLPTWSFFLPHQQLAVPLSSQHALCGDVLGDVSHVAVQLRQGPCKICNHNGLKRHTVRSTSVAHHFVYCHYRAFLN